VKGDATKEDVFSEIDKLLSSSLDKKTEIVASA
jgi:adenylate kinase